MFLATKELKHDKLRYAMLIIITSLIAWMIFLLAGLANGLNTGMRQVVDQWQPNKIILNASANKNLNASHLKIRQLSNVSATKSKNPVVEYAGALKTKQRKINIAFFGTTRRAAILPKLIAGHQVSRPNEIIISKGLVQAGIKVNQLVEIGNAPAKLKVVGVYQTSTYGMTPTIYGDIGTVNAAISGTTDKKSINAIVVRGASKATDPKLEKLAKITFINNIPGYTAQNTTLRMMIDFLIVIAAAVIGIFIYVMTLQKKAMYGILKAQGVGNKVIVNALIIQSLIIGISGVLLGWGLLWLTALVLPASMPFAIDYPWFGIYSVGIILAALSGAIFSFRTIIKVDPATAIQ